MSRSSNRSFTSRVRIVAAGLVAVLAVGCGAATGGPNAGTPEAGAPGAGANANAGPNGSGVAVSPTTAPDGAGTAGDGSHLALPTLLPESIQERVPTRVRIRDLGIDLPVVAPPPDPAHYPYCNVAEFLASLSVPGRPGTTFLYAHARPGMFLPILEASGVAGGRSLLGTKVEVYTSDDRVFEYRMAEVERHVTSLESVYRETAEQLVLQTSEGPHGTIPKTMVIAEPAAEEPAAHEDAHPTPNPVRCEP